MCDFTLPFYCLCEYQTDVKADPHVVLNETTYQTYTPNLVYKVQGITHWSFYLIFRSENNTHSFMHNTTKQGQSKYLEIYINDTTQHFKRQLRFEQSSIDSLLILRLVSIGKTVFLVWRMVSSHKSVATDLAFFTSWWHHDELTDTRRYCTAVSSNTIVICWPCSTASIAATFCNTYCLRKWYFTHLVWRFGLCRTAGGWITTTDQ